MVEDRDHEAARVRAFYNHLRATLELKGSEVSTITVAHVLPDAPHFLSSLNYIAPIRVLLPKPKSAESKAGAKTLQDPAVVGFPQVPLSREEISQYSFLRQLVLGYVPAGESFILNDIGGYFAVNVENLKNEFGERFLGVLEGTENGVLEYEKIYRTADTPPTCSLVTVARSTLKLPEDYLVGAGIVFSIESVLREHGQILQSRTASVIGFGRVGRAVAESLRGRGLSTIVYDIDPIARAEAAVRGYPVAAHILDAVSHSSLIVSATSARPLTPEVLGEVRSGTAIASVTSRDSEFSDLKALQARYHHVPLDDDNHIVRLEDVANRDRYIWLINNGDAPNFIHGAILGPALHLISAEKLAALAALVRGEIDPAQSTAGQPMQELDRATRRAVATVWNEHFL